MTPVKIDLEPHTRGDRWQGIATIGPILVNGAAPAETLTGCRMQLRRNGELGHTLSTDPEEGEGTINIVDAETWELSIPEQALPLEQGAWQWDMEFRDSSSALPMTFYRGTLVVAPDVTQ